MEHKQDGSLSDMDAALVWFGLSGGKAIGAIGCIVGPISLTTPLWRPVAWSWANGLMGITGTIVSALMFYVFSRLKRGFERSLQDDHARR